MEFHPFCLLLSYREEVVSELTELMIAHGWYPQEHITLYEGQILDGRHRYLAAQKAEVDPQFMDFKGDHNAAIAFVFGANAMSRHFSTSDKKNFFLQAREAGFWEKREVGLTRADEKEDTQNPISNREIAEILGVNISTISAWETERTSPKPVRTDTTGNDEWYTPVKYIDLAREVMGGIDLDPASCDFAQKSVDADTFFTIKNDGLTQPWNGRLWVNPPYSKGLIDRFVEKLREEYAFGHVEQAIVLTHNFTDTAWFHALAADAAALCFTKGRIKFHTTEGVGKSPTSGHVFFYFGPDIDMFAEKFEEVGLVLVPH